MPGNDAARDSQLGRVCTRGVPSMYIILLKLYFIVKTQCRCRKCWLIGKNENLENLMGFKPNFSLRKQLPTTVWQLVPPRIWTKVKSYHHETLLYPDVRKKMVNSTIHACPLLIMHSVPQWEADIQHNLFWVEGYYFRNETLAEY